MPGQSSGLTEHHVRDVIDRIPTMAWSTRADGSGEFFNRMCLDYLGLSEADLTESGWLSAFHPDDWARLTAHRERAFAAGQAAETEARLRGADGAHRWFLIRVAPFRDTSGNITTWYGTHTDIDDRRAAEELLRQSEAFLVQAQSLSHSGSWAYHVERKMFVHWSTELSRIWELDSALVTRSPCEVAGERVHPDDRELFALACHQGIRDKTNVDFEHRLLMPDGSLKHIQTVAKPVLDDRGYVATLVGTSSDVTRRKSAEAELLRVERLRMDERASERTRIAQDLHDTLLQSIQGMMLCYQAVDFLLPHRAAEAKVVLQRALSIAERAIAEGRDAVQGLRVASVIGNDLANAIRVIGQELGQGIQGDPALRPSFTVQTRGEPREVQPILREDIYQFVREAVRNAFRHAFARRIEVEIVFSESLLRVRIRDDGTGIEAPVLNEGGRVGHWGLTGMRERAERIGAQCQVRSHRGAGTEVDLSVPSDVVYASIGFPSRDGGQENGPPD
ncbi:MAG: PAS domain-containing protein [Cytophagaceae bacterium]|nr:PAS domain-containing protein [Gemmatimonadaceae bacterium]